jgi:hypothetical protein
VTKRGTSNGNQTGSAKNRAVRRTWLLTTFGDGVTASCALANGPWCLGTVDSTTLTVDRIVPGCKGGRYIRGNIRPACGPCNSRHGGGLRRDTA